MLLTTQGAPGAGKTSLGTQFAAHCALTHGSKIYIYAPDEGTRAACVRLGQFVGIDRDLLERTREEALDELQRAYGPGIVNLVDADAAEAVLETFLDQIAEEYVKGAPPPVFYADSIQTIRTDLDETFEGSNRARIEYVMGTIKSATRDIPMIADLVSHVSRPTFASKDPEQRIDPLAGAAESAVITRDSDALIHLEGEIHEGVRGWLRKNRLHRGETPHFGLLYEVPRGAFGEADPASASEARSVLKDQRTQARETAKRAEHEKLVVDTAADVERRLRKASTRMTGRQLHELVGCKYPIFKEALTGLEAQGVIDWREGDRRSVLWGLRGSD